ncbi:hypothetical protein BCR42DRAFT_402106 [Absidia repens]|uniref:Uncharacterized protein n=1 Tax=Absidia repens TaxID=90262 RepID=A0A1X2IXP1_9FUNG|nr:hypothetical protein BCR42DRAFT_402106 [Absidia repens]
MTLQLALLHVIGDLYHRTIPLFLLFLIMIPLELTPIRIYILSHRNNLRSALLFRRGITNHSVTASYKNYQLLLKKAIL